MILWQFFILFMIILNKIKSENVDRILSRALRNIPQFNSPSFFNNQPQYYHSNSFYTNTYMQPQMQKSQFYQPYYQSKFTQPQPQPQPQMPRPSFSAPNTLNSNQEDVFGKCGILKPKLVNYVSNGENTDNKLWPWYVQVVIAGNNKSDSETFCGGTIIHKKFVLTAAHCYDDLLPSKRARNTLILARGIEGGNRVYKNGFRFRAKAVYIHPKYVPAMTDFEARIKGVTPGPLNDIALIELRHENHEIYDNVMPACLPKTDYQLKVNTQCKIMGHGFMNSNDESNSIMPSILQMANVRVSSNQACKDEVESNSIKTKINQDTVCIRGPIHPCVGDSGGPLICAGETSSKIYGTDSFEYDDSSEDYNNEPKQLKWYLCGVTSFAVSTDENDKCGQFKSAVFGKVSNYVEWLKSIIVQ